MTPPALTHDDAVGFGRTRTAFNANLPL